ASPVQGRTRQCRTCFEKSLFAPFTNNVYAGKKNLINGGGLSFRPRHAMNSISLACSAHDGAPGEGIASHKAGRTSPRTNYIGRFAQKRTFGTEKRRTAALPSWVELAYFATAP